MTLDHIIGLQWFLVNVPTSIYKARYLIKA
jgi:hypothetical protein